MTRHGKNNTASACYTYHERQKDAKTGGYGTVRERLGKDSVKDFDACCLTLQPCRNPVITPSGYIFDKEAILEYILKKKAEAVKRVKEFEKAKKKSQKEQQELAAARETSRAQAFADKQKLVNASSSETTSTHSAGSNIKSVSNMAGDRASKLPSFWVPSEVPTSSPSSTSNLLGQKPDTNVYCPMSGKVLKTKDLYPIIFTPIDEVATGTANAVKKERYMCPVTHDVLSNSVPCCYLKTSGSVVTAECVEKIIRKDMMDPVNGKKLKESDIIYIQRGGTGYSSTNKVEASISKPSLHA